LWNLEPKTLKFGGSRNTAKKLRVTCLAFRFPVFFRAFLRGGEVVAPVTSTVTWLPVAEGAIALISTVEIASEFSRHDIIIRA
jgi:hypothetical protein